jgi:hypothetical protein
LALAATVGAKARDHGPSTRTETAIKPKAPVEGFSIVSPSPVVLVPVAHLWQLRETMDDAVRAGWRFGGLVLRSITAMTWSG